MKKSATDMAEAFTLRRAWATIVMGLVFVVSQVASLGDPALGKSSVAHLAAWIGWTLVLLLFLAWSAGALARRPLGHLANDENTVEHRQQAMTAGFWCALIAALVVYSATFYEFLSARDACRLFVTATLSPALIRFGWLELRALRRD
jgi:hypothetical protein